MTNTSEHCFEFKNVSFAWTGGRTVLANQCFNLPPGVFAVVRGLSGAGKSTLLRLMNRLEEPTSGAIYYRGRELVECDPPWLRQQVAYLQQMPVVPDVTVRETLIMPFGYLVNKRLEPPSDKALESRLDRLLLGSVGLDERAATLSVGQRQRLCLVRALMVRPDVLLLDEPTASLDRESKAVVESITEETCAGGVTVIMVSHDEFRPAGMPVAEIRIENGKVDLCL